MSEETTKPTEFLIYGGGINDPVIKLMEAHERALVERDNARAIALALRCMLTTMEKGGVPDKELLQRADGILDKWKAAL